MWKIIFIVLFIVAILGMGAFLLLPDQKIIPHLKQTTTTTTNTVSQSPVQNTQQAGAPSPQAADANPQTLTTHSIKNILNNGETVECEYTDTEGRKAKTYIKNGNARTDYTAQKADDSASTIVKDKKMFVWNISSKQGYIMDLSTGTNGSLTNSQTTYNVIADLEKFSQTCKPATIADSLFVPPADVKLDDYSNQGPSQSADTPAPTQ